MKNICKFSDLKKIIELCGDNGVTELHLGELKIVFGGQTKVTPLTPSIVQTKDEEVQTQQIEKEALAEASQSLDANDLALMQIEDPIRYEQMLIEGELEDDGSGSTISDEHQSIIDSTAYSGKSERTQTPQH